jgi:hypothetical protein
MAPNAPVAGAMFCRAVVGRQSLQEAPSQGRQLGKS